MATGIKARLFLSANPFYIMAILHPAASNSFKASVGILLCPSPSTCPAAEAIAPNPKTLNREWNSTSSKHTLLSAPSPPHFITPSHPQPLAVFCLLTPHIHEFLCSSNKSIPPWFLPMQWHLSPLSAKSLLCSPQAFGSDPALISNAPGPCSQG